MNCRSDLASSPEFKGKSLVIYDGHCPFCSRYVRYQRLLETLGEVALVDARDRPDLVHAFSAAGMPLDQGMALVMDGQVYYGADCMHRLALLSSRNGLFNRINALVFRSAGVSRLLYPALRAGRNLTLRALGHKFLEQDC
jgi:predicted DCC family thiol-disulfide oxidoreductase YuxK